MPKRSRPGDSRAVARLGSESAEIAARDASAFAARLRDPLSDVARRERRTLLGVAALGIAVAKIGILPEHISALGIDLSVSDQRAFLAMLGAAILYFVLAFALYSLPDFWAWQRTVLDAMSKRLQDLANDLEKVVPDGFDNTERGRDILSAMARIEQRRRSPWLGGGWASPTASVVRGAFDFLLPLAVGVYAVALVWTTEPPAPSQQSPSLSPSVSTVLTPDTRRSPTPRGSQAQNAREEETAVAPSARRSRRTRRSEVAST